MNTIDFWVKNVAIKGKAVVCYVTIWWDRGTEAENWYLFVTVIVLKNVTDGADRLQVFILLHIQVVE